MVKGVKKARKMGRRRWGDRHLVDLGDGGGIVL